MKRIFAFLMILLSVAIVVEADSPPAFKEYEVYSTSKKYVAYIRIKDWKEKTFILKTFVYGPQGLELLWKTDFSHTGYVSGYLSNDGTTLVNLDPWYSEEGPVIQVYQNGQFKEIIGKEVNVDQTKLVRTVSHTLWLKRRDKPKFVYDQKQVAMFQFETIDSKKHSIDLKSLQLK